MEKTTQDGRQLTISTPLGKDVLLLNKMSASEGISELFRIHVELLHQEEDEGIEPTIVDINQLLGQAVTITVEQEDESARTFSGIVNEFSQGNRDALYSYYYATIVPSIWILTQNVQSRIFQHKSVPDILREVFAGFEVSYEMTGTFEPRNYCVQYRESDFDFASRLMEEEGIYYYFEHSGINHKLILGNTPQAHRDCPNKNQISFLIPEHENQHITEVKTWRTEYRLQSGKVTFWDHNFQLPNQKLEFSQPTRHQVGGNQKLEIYDYPGGYSRKFDGIDKSGGEAASNLSKITIDKEKTVKNRMEALDAQYQIASGVADCSAMSAGHRFTLTSHPSQNFNGQYVITAANHEAEQTPSYISDTEVSRAYEVSFACIKMGAGNPTFRPRMKTPKPIIQGSQTAVVVGPAGEEIFTDKYGRVKVQFHWDRYGRVDSDSSCWVRVAQTWAGNKWGAMFIPRIGMEVIVHFLDGDPDQPIITGCVYNAAAMPPYTLPDEKTKSTLKTNSSKGGAGFNEFRIEDKKGEEQIFIHGEKNLDIRIKNDAKEIIRRDRHLIVEQDQIEKVKRDKHLTVTGNQNEKIDGAFSKKVGTNIQEKAGQKVAIEAGTEVHIKAGMTATIEAGTMLTLKVGGNSIGINSGGIFISGTMVNINSASVSGSGSGSNPDPPKDPLEADTANPGDRVQPMTPPPPKTPETYSQKAQAIQNASASGAPFVSN